MPRVPPRGQPIQKGEVRNPKGSSARARSMAALRKAHKTMTGDEFAHLVSTFMSATPAEVVAAKNDPNASILYRLVANFLSASHNKADIQIFKVLLEAVIGRPRERKSHEISGPDGGPIPTAQKSESEILAEIEALRAARTAVERAKK